MSFYMYVLVMAGVTWLIRVIPLVLINKEIKNKPKTKPATGIKIDFFSYMLFTT